MNRVTSARVSSPIELTGVFTTQSLGLSRPRRKMRIILKTLRGKGMSMGPGKHPMAKADDETTCSRDGNRFLDFFRARLIAAVPNILPNVRSTLYSLHSLRFHEMLARSLPFSLDVQKM